MNPDDPASMHVELMVRIVCTRCEHMHRPILADRCPCCRDDLKRKRDDMKAKR